MTEKSIYFVLFFVTLLSASFADLKIKKRPITRHSRDLLGGLLGSGTDLLGENGGGGGSQSQSESLINIGADVLSSKTSGFTEIATEASESAEDVGDFHEEGESVEMAESQEMEHSEEIMQSQGMIHSQEMVHSEEMVQSEEMMNSQEMMMNSQEMAESQEMVESQEVQKSRKMKESEKMEASKEEKLKKKAGELPEKKSTCKQGKKMLYVVYKKLNDQ